MALYAALAVLSLVSASGHCAPTAVDPLRAFPPPARSAILASAQALGLRVAEDGSLRRAADAAASGPGTALTGPEADRLLRALARVEGDRPGEALARWLAAEVPAGERERFVRADAAGRPALTAAGRDAAIRRLAGRRPESVRPAVPRPAEAAAAMSAGPALALESPAQAYDAARSAGRSAGPASADSPAGRWRLPGETPRAADAAAEPGFKVKEPPAAAAPGAARPSASPGAAVRAAAVAPLGVAERQILEEMLDEAQRKRWEKYLLAGGSLLALGFALYTGNAPTAIMVAPGTAAAVVDVVNNELKIRRLKEKLGIT